MHLQALERDEAAEDSSMPVFKRIWCKGPAQSNVKSKLESVRLLSINSHMWQVLTVLEVMSNPWTGLGASSESCCPANVWHNQIPFQWNLSLLEAIRVQHQQILSLQEFEGSEALEDICRQHCERILGEEPAHPSPVSHNCFYYTSKPEWAIPDDNPKSKYYKVVKSSKMAHFVKIWFCHSCVAYWTYSPVRCVRPLNTWGWISLISLWPWRIETEPSTCA